MLRRDFLAVGAAAAAASQAIGGMQAGLYRAISSGNGLPAVNRAVELMKQGVDTLDAAISGVNIVEDDPNDDSVGLGGLPNEEGVVELDSCVMHGPSKRRAPWRRSATSRIRRRSPSWSWSGPITASSSAKGRCGSPRRTASRKKTC